MDLQEWLTNQVKNERAINFNLSDQLSLGEILEKVKDIINSKESETLKELSVYFDFEYLFPTDLDSWRGIYAEIALNYTSEGTPLNVVEFKNLIENAIGNTYEGYKGGDFYMTESTPVWVANYGRSGNTAVIDIIDDGYQVLIMTAYRNS